MLSSCLLNQRRRVWHQALYPAHRIQCLAIWLSFKLSSLAKPPNVLCLGVLTIGAWYEGKVLAERIALVDINPTE